MPGRDLFALVARRPLLVLLPALVMAALAFAWVRDRSVVYEATATVAPEARADETQLEAEVATATSPAVLEAAAQRVGPSAGGTDALAARVRAARVPGTRMIELTASAPEPALARDLANAVAHAYVENRRAAAAARAAERRQVLEGQVADAAQRARRADEALWGFLVSRDPLRPTGPAAALAALAADLERDLDRTRRQRAELEAADARLAAARVADRVAVETSNAAVQRLQAIEADLVLERTMAPAPADWHPHLAAIDDRVRKVRAEMRRQLAAQIALLRGREAALTRRLDDLRRQGQEVPEAEVTLAGLERERQVSTHLLAQARARLLEAALGESLATGASVVQPAAEPPAPLAGRTLGFVGLGAVLGLAIGLGLAVVRERFAPLGNPAEVEQWLGVPVLGVVPAVEADEALARLVERRPDLDDVEADMLRAHALLIVNEPALADAFRAIRGSVDFVRARRGGKALAVAGAAAGDDAGLAAVNLAVAMAETGRRTLLVAADLRHSRVDRFFGLETVPGLSDALAGEARWIDCVRTPADMMLGRLRLDAAPATPGLAELHVLPAGPVPPNPAELLAQPAMAKLLREARSEYDAVVVEAPAVLDGDEAPVVLAQVDGVVLVHGAGSRGALARGRDRVEAAGATPWGVILVENAKPSRAASRGVRRFLLGAVAVALAGAAVGVAAGAAGWLGDVPVQSLARRDGGDGEGQAAVNVAASTEDPAGPARLPITEPAPTTELAPTEAAVRPAPAASPGGPHPAAAIAPAPRFAVEFGPYPSAAEAERVERSLNDAGHTTARFRQHAGDAYAVLVEDTGAEPDPQALANALRDRGFTETSVVASEGRAVVQVGAPLALRPAVQTAERLRADGFRVRLAVQSQDAEAFVVRHGNFASREEAEQRARDLALLGLASHVVRVR